MLEVSIFEIVSTQSFPLVLELIEVGQILFNLNLKCNFRNVETDRNERQ